MIVFNSILLILGLVYSFIRYNVNQFRIEDDHLIYFFNKGLAFSSIISMSLSYIIGNSKKLGFTVRQKYLDMIKYFGVIGFLSASIHVLISLMLISYSKFPYLYKDNLNFNMFGEMTILFGVASLGLFMMPAITSIAAVRKAMVEQSWKRYQQIGYLGLLSVLFHVFFVDFVNISAFTEWAYLMLPLSYIAWLFILAALSLKLISLIFGLKRRAESKSPTDI